MESPISGEQRALIPSRATLPNSGFGSLTARPWRHGHGEEGDAQKTERQTKGSGTFFGSEVSPAMSGNRPKNEPDPNM